MNDQIPADKVREILDEWERIKEYADWDDIDNLVRDVRDLLPTPKPMTLADMTEEERDACQWMQADTKLWGRVVIIVPDLGDGRAALLDRSGDVIYGRYVNATPRPDLPRLTWPGDRVAEDVAPAKAGTVIDSADDPRLAALPIDSILLDRDGDAVTKERKTWTGPGYIPIPREGDEFGPWKVIYIGREAADAVD